MKLEDICYLAGLFDGEGCATIQKKARHAFQPRVTITNTNFVVLNDIQKTLGYGVIYTHIRNERTKHKTCYELSFRVHEIPRFLELIKPYLRIKVEQATLLLEFFNYSDEQRATRNAIADEILELNKKGPE